MAPAVARRTECIGGRTSAAALTRYYAKRERDEAIDRLVDSVERASPRYLGNLGPFYAAPRPCPSLLRPEWRWTKAGSVLDRLKRVANRAAYPCCILRFRGHPSAPATVFSCAQLGLLILKRPIAYRRTGACSLQQPFERMGIEQIAVFKILAEHVKALVPAEPLQLRRMGAGLHAGGERAAPEAVAAEVEAPEAGLDRAVLHDARDRAGRQRLGADDGQGRGPPPTACGARNSRRNTGPSAMATASSQADSARTGQSSVPPYGSGTITASVCEPLLRFSVNS